MKMVKSMLVLSALSIAATTVGATDWCDISPFAGVDYKYSHMGVKGDWRTAIAHKYHGGNIYAGFKFHENFGLEAGYEQTAKESKSLTSSNSSFLRGVTANASTKFNTKLKIYHLDLNYYCPVQECLELMASVGVGLMDPKLTYDTFQAGGVTYVGQRVPMKHTAIARLRAGAQYLITETVGVRALLGFDNTCRATLKNSAAAAGLKQKPFKDTYSASLGIFAKF